MLMHLHALLSALQNASFRDKLTPKNSRFLKLSEPTDSFFYAVSKSTTARPAAAVTIKSLTASCRDVSDRGKRLHIGKLGEKHDIIATL